MPLIRCDIDGKQGWKWGQSGKCYLRKEDALEQAKAILASQAQQKDEQPELRDEAPLITGVELYDGQD